MDKTKDKTCEDANCRLSGFRNEDQPSGERVISARLKHNGEFHVKKINLAETTVNLIKRDKRFAKYFQDLLMN